MINTKVLSPGLAFRFSVRTFSTSDKNHRDRSVIYNCENRPEPVLDEKFREKVRNKRIRELQYKYSVSFLAYKWIQASTIISNCSSEQGFYKKCTKYAG